MTDISKKLEETFNQAKGIEQLLTSNQFIAVLKKLVNDISQVSDGLLKRIEKTEKEIEQNKVFSHTEKAELRETIEKIRKSIPSEKDIENRILAKVPQPLRMEDILREIYPIIPNMPDVDRAKLEAIEESVSKVKELIPEQQTIEEIRNGLERLKNEERLDVSAIKGIQNKFDELESKITKSKGGGGVSNARIIQSFKYILKTEQPSGTIDGANTDFTVTQPIFAVLAFSLNGEVIAELPNYTISGKTISFSQAIPAGYSGSDFEVKYI